MTQTIDITYLCKIRGFSKYKLEKDSSGNYTYITTISTYHYRSFVITEFLNPVYIKDVNIFPYSKYDGIQDTYTIYIPIISDPVVIQDFNSFEDKQISLPIGQQPITTQQLTGWNNPVYKRIIDEPKGCSHEWTIYTGLSHSFEFCKKCDEKRNIV